MSAIRLIGGPRHGDIVDIGRLPYRLVVPVRPDRPLVMVFEAAADTVLSQCSREVIYRRCDGIETSTGEAVYLSDDLVPVMVECVMTYQQVIDYITSALGESGINSYCVQVGSEPEPCNEDRGGTVCIPSYSSYGLPPSTEPLPVAKPWTKDNRHDIIKQIDEVIDDG